MKTMRVADAERKETPHGVDVRMLVDEEAAQAVHITLEPGEGLKLHATPVDAFFYVLEGEPTVEVGEEKETVRADTIVVSPARIPHRIVNDSSARARILVTKAPRPTEKTRIL